MAVKIKCGDLLTTGEDIIGHQVNCSMVMGSGIAKSIRDRYPIAFEQYIGLLQSIDSSQALGRCQIVKDPNTGKYIANLYGQLSYGRNKNIVYTNYDAVRSYLCQLKDYAQTHKLSVALPHKIGCGLANGDWSIVLNIISDVFDDYDVTICYWRGHV